MKKIEHPNDNRLKKIIWVRLYAELNDFLHLEQQQKEFALNLKTPVLVSEALESMGIPLSEVDLVLVNSQPAGFKQHLYGGDHLSAFPTFESFDISGLATRQKTPLRATKFILDAHLGKLSKYLRMLGFDSLYRNDFGDDEIIDIAANEKRIILTRDKLLLKSPKVSHGYYVRAINKHEQLHEVIRKFDLNSQFRSFTRCMTCNSPLLSVTAESIRDKTDSGIRALYDEFFLCPQCDKVFWKGSHFKRMEELILDLIRERADP
ncbi:MAG: hypothetical protein JW801_14830 [Bacteroidales bacterium]|nr:hypothetical protein [Bacteroidales bacterium]